MQPSPHVRAPRAPRASEVDALVPELLWAHYIYKTHALRSQCQIIKHLCPFKSYTAKSLVLTQ